MLLFLIGFMGSGKSYTGKRLSAKTGLPFYDLDLLIEADAQKTIREIFSEGGEEQFRQIETRVLKECAALEPAIISCGGGTPCFFDNMAWMNANGTTVWLNPPMDLLYHRLIRKPEKRPLLADLETETDWKNFLSKTMNSRLPYYRQAQYSFAQHSDNEDAATAIYDLVFRKKA
jgi:shikimate kinase